MTIEHVALTAQILATAVTVYWLVDARIKWKESKRVLDSMKMLDNVTQEAFMCANYATDVYCNGQIDRKFYLALSAKKYWESKRQLEKAWQEEKEKKKQKEEA